MTYLRPYIHSPQTRVTSPLDNVRKRSVTIFFSYYFINNILKRALSEVFRGTVEL